MRLPALLLPRLVWGLWHPACPQPICCPLHPYLCCCSLLDLFWAAPHDCMYPVCPTVRPVRFVQLTPCTSVVKSSLSWLSLVVRPAQKKFVWVFFLSLVVLLSLQEITGSVHPWFPPQRSSSDTMLILLTQHPGN
jgi:hypothetical protein